VGYDGQAFGDRDSGRDPDTLGIRASLPVAATPDLEQRLADALAAAPTYVAAGATVLQIPLSRLAARADDITRVVATAARAIAQLH